MYFGVCRFLFEEEERSPDDVRLLHQLAEKIRARFRVSCEAISHGTESGALGIAVAFLDQSEERIFQTVDAISTFCEESGFGRIESEDSLVDHVDIVGNEDLESYD